ncbi:MAG TPA: bacteriophage holin [Gammaproteobacteria bacterium]|nr:bacteriophage holin [Gammaproteobacteria bacterium]
MADNMRLSVIGLGVALGTAWAVGLFALGILSWLTGWGTDMVQVLGSLYIGYEPTLIGTIIGTIWAFIDCFICGVIIAWVYNRVA